MITQTRQDPFQEAHKEQLKLHMSISGLSGYGKTYTALMIATYLAEKEAGKVALLDTEGQSSKHYADIFKFSQMSLSDKHDPALYIQAINDAVQFGYTVLIIDSFSASWTGVNGVLDIADKQAAKSKSPYGGWIKARPAQNNLIQAIITAPIHIICTMREKAEHILETNSKGKQAPIKIGTQPVQSKDISYEFDLAFQLDREHTLLVEKSRCIPLNEQGTEFPDIEHAMDIIYAWLSDGEQPTPYWANQESVKGIFVKFREQGLSDDEIMKLANISAWNNYQQWQRYESADGAIQAISDNFDHVLNEDSPEAASNVPDNSEHTATFRYMNYIGKHSNLQFATNPPDSKHNTYAILYGGRGAIRAWNNELCEQLQLEQYDGIKGKNIVSDFVKMIVPVDFRFVSERRNGEDSFKIVGIVGDPAIPY